MVTKKIYKESKKIEREGNEGSRVCVVQEKKIEVMEETEVNLSEARRG